MAEPEHQVRQQQQQQQQQRSSDHPADDQRTGDDLAQYHDGNAMPTPPLNAVSDCPATDIKTPTTICTTQLPAPSPPTIPSSAPPVPTLPTILAGHSDEDLSSDSASASATAHANTNTNTNTNRGSTRPSKSLSVSEPASAVDDKQDVSSYSVKTPARAGSASFSSSGGDHVRRLSSAGMQQLTSEPDSIPIAVVPENAPIENQDRPTQPSLSEQLRSIRQQVLEQPEIVAPSPLVDATRSSRTIEPSRRPTGGRTLSTPPGNRQRQQQHRHQSQTSSPRRNSFNPAGRPPPPLNLNNINGFALRAPSPADHRAASTSSFQLRPPSTEPAIPSPMPPSIPLPPMSIPTHLQLELSTQRPSPLYIHQSHSNDIPYESMAVKIERLLNVLVVPLYLERTLYFGALACLDAWLYNFTILPMRFCAAVSVLVKWWAYVLGKEVRWVMGYVWGGLGRIWTRGRRGSMQQQQPPDGDHSVDQRRDRSQSAARRSMATNEQSTDSATPHTRRESDVKANGNGHPAATPASHFRGQAHQHNGSTPRPSSSGVFRHRRTRSMPSNLTSMHKADLLQGAIIVFSSAFLMRLDASRMYHVIRGQDAIKLYVIYNVLEVGDRLLSALGQDIFECLFSSEALSRNNAGRSKVLLPFGLFMLALIYNCMHSTVLYYQVITLNVAVNSYSNALLTLLLSNQFVEIKSTVFKRFEKDNLFQLTCADITERFQLWLMLFIIGMRNVVEVGGLSIPGTGFLGDLRASSTKPLHSPSILPHSFTVLPSWLMSGEVLSPFLIVIGSEMLVDTIKHAYINKFNRIRPKFYSRILDILCKDYYTNAFSTPALTRRVGLAVLPLACLFIRASIQTYFMFLSSHVPAPIPQSTQTSLTSESATPSSPVMLATLDRIDTLLRDALGRAVYGGPAHVEKANSWIPWTTDDLIAAVTMLVFFFLAFLVLLVIKILLGMALLRYSRNRYAHMKSKEHLVNVGQAEVDSYDAKGKRLGGYGHVEVTDDKSRWLHADKDEGLKGKGRPEKSAKPPQGEYQGVQRFEMVTKRIW